MRPTDPEPGFWFLGAGFTEDFFDPNPSSMSHGFALSDSPSLFHVRRHVTIRSHYGGSAAQALGTWKRQTGCRNMWCKEVHVTLFVFTPLVLTNQRITSWESSVQITKCVPYAVSHLTSATDVQNNVRFAEHIPHIEQSNPTQSHRNQSNPNQRNRNVLKSPRAAWSYFWGTKEVLLQHVRVPPVPFYVRQIDFTHCQETKEKILGNMLHLFPPHRKKWSFVAKLLWLIENNTTREILQKVWQNYISGTCEYATEIHSGKLRCQVKNGCFQTARRTGRQLARVAPEAEFI